MPKIRVNIYDRAFVPALGRGPFTDKLIDVELFRSLKRLGYLVEEITEPVVKKVTLATDEVVAAAVELETTPVVEEEVVEETPVVEVTEEDEVVEEDEDVLFTDEEISFLSKKAKRAEILSLFEEKGVEVTDSDATIGELLALVGLTRK